jgi:predicted nuclease with TOPRIM domain
MSNVHTLKDIEDRRVVGGLLGKQIPSGHRLGNIRESELKKALRGSIKSASDIANDYKDLQDIYLERVRDFNRICSGFNNKFSRLNTANTELKAKYSAEIRSLKSNIKTLERELTLAQKVSSADKVQILSLETKIHELEGKLEDIDLERTYHDLDVMGGVIEEPVKMPKLPNWLHDNLRSVVCELGLENKVMELDKKLAKEDILEKTLSQF